MAKNTDRRARSGVTRLADGRLRYTRRPTQDELTDIGCAPMVEFELSEKETRDLRIELYRINKDGIRRYRTMREGPILLVWRIK